MESTNDTFTIKHPEDMTCSKHGGGQSVAIYVHAVEVARAGCPSCWAEWQAEQVAEWAVAQGITWKTSP
jgi:hypothetical protein